MFFLNYIKVLGQIERVQATRASSTFQFSHQTSSMLPYYCVVYILNAITHETFLAEIPIEVRVNNVKIDTKTTPLNDFRASGEYMYHEGELAKITCSTQKEHFMSMEYKDGELTTVFFNVKVYYGQIGQEIIVLNLR